MNYYELLREKIFPQVQTPGQYTGAELNMIRKSPQDVRGHFCLAFPDTYGIGMSCHGMQVLYNAVNRVPDWYCERVFAPMTDMESKLREYNIPLTSLETSRALCDFHVLGFSLQHELCYTNILTMLDLGHIPLHTEDRSLNHPLVIAGGPCVQNPEPLADFIDLYILGDGEYALPAVCQKWLELKDEAISLGHSRPVLLRKMAAAFPWVYVPSCYNVPIMPDGRAGRPRPRYEDVPEYITQAVVENLDDIPLPDAPVVPNVEAVQDRIAMEIMRGCPWRCRFCQSNPIRRPVRFRKVDHIVSAACAAYHDTGYEELSLLSLSTSDYPWFETLTEKLRHELGPYGVSISVPSLRVNQHLSQVGEILTTERHSGLTVAPEAALDELRNIIGKRITNQDLLDGCRVAFSQGFQRVKLYFMVGLPGEITADHDGMISLADEIARLGKEVSGRWPMITLSISNLIPKPQTPFQWYAMPSREYFSSAHRYIKNRRLPKSLSVKYHGVDGSLLEGVLCRGDRRVGAAIECVWRYGARFDSWSDQFKPDLWWRALDECQIDVNALIHKPYTLQDELPWDHIRIQQGRDYLEKEFLAAQEAIKKRDVN